MFEPRQPHGPDCDDTTIPLGTEFMGMADYDSLYDLLDEASEGEVSAESRESFMAHVADSRQAAASAGGVTATDGARQADTSIAARLAPTTASRPARAAEPALEQLLA